MSWSGHIGSAYSKLFSEKNLRYAKSVLNHGARGARSIGKYSAAGALAGGAFSGYYEGSHDRSVLRGALTGALAGGAFLGGARASRMMYNRMRSPFMGKAAGVAGSSGIGAGAAAKAAPRGRTAYTSPHFEASGLGSSFGYGGSSYSGARRTTYPSASKKPTSY
jgi:hypothetical protein